MKQALYLTTLLALLLTACSPNNKTEVKEAETTQSEAVGISGKWVGDNQYVNDYFGLVVDIPEGWNLVKGSSEQMKETARKFLSENSDQKMKQLLESSTDNTYTAFWAHRYPVGTPGKTNPNVSLMVENVEQSPSIQSVDDYMLAMENTLKRTNKGILFSGQPSRVNIGGLEFCKREITMPVGQLKVQQKHYAMKKGNYVLLIGVTIISEEDKQIISQLTDTIRKSGK